MPAQPATIQNLLNTPMLDRNGRITPPWLRWFNDIEIKTRQPIDQQGVVTAASIDFARAYTNKSQDNVPDGAARGAVLLSALTGNQVDLTKAGVLGPLGSVKIAKNVMLNFTNNATVDSIDNGTNATIRVYGPGGAGTSWNQYVGSVKGADLAAASLAGYAYSASYYVYFDGASFHVTQSGFDTLPDGLILCGSVTTVAAGGGGGTSGGGGTGGGSGGKILLA